MTTETLTSAFKNNWILCAVFAFCVVGGLLGLSAPDTPTPVAAQAQAACEAPLTADGTDLSLREKTGQRTKTTIAEYQQRLDQQPDAPEAPALLFAVGNLYRQKLMDYAEAAKAYEMLLASYPDWPGATNVYVQLVTCYERLGDKDSAHRVYAKILDRFPKGSPEHLFAEGQRSVQW